jgi:ribonucleoside-diphosphate reductase alpha chain
MCLMNQLFKNNQLAEDVFTEKYALPGETPDQLFTRIANEFITQEKCRYQTLTKEHRNEIKDKLSTLGKIYLETLEKEDETLHDIFYTYLSNFTNIIPGGSVLSTLGTDKLSSLSNCFVISSPEDSITGIFNTCNEQSQLMKYRGGVGFDISTLRPSKSKVKNSAQTSSGSVSFTHLFSQVTNTIAQNGRRGK